MRNPTWGLAVHWKKWTSRDAIFAKFGMQVAVAILRLSVQKEFQLLPTTGRWRGRKFENRPTLALCISKPKVDRTSQKIALGRSGCD